MSQRASGPEAQPAHEESEEGVTGAGPYSEELNPAFRPGEYVSLEPIGEVREVDMFSPQPGVTVALEVGTQGQLLTPIEMPTRMLGQYRLLTPSELNDDVYIEVDQLGRNSMKFSTKNDRGAITQETISNSHSGNMTELYQWQDSETRFSVYTDGSGDTADGDEIELTFSGFSYLLSEEVSEGEAGGEPWNVPVGPIRPDRRP